METRIAVGLEGTRARLALVVGLAAVGFDLAQRGGWGYSLPRLGLGFAMLLFLVSQAGGNRQSVGLSRKIDPSLSYWPKCILILGGLIIAGSLAVIAGLWAFGTPPQLYSQFTSSDQIPEFLWRGCLWAPIEEEMLYRVALCVPLVPLVGKRWTILIGGLTFAALHWSYGNLAPNHAFAGFALTWAYLRSGNLFVPIALHALGNLAVCALHAGLFYWG